MIVMTPSHLLVGSAIFVTLALSVMLLIAIANTLTFPRLRSFVRSGSHASETQSVSILIPARQEEERIGNTVRSLLAQDGEDFEIIVLDDDSDDATYVTALEAACGDARARVLRGRPLPVGWTGKNWACWQLAEAANHDVLVFTDADVTWNPGALTAVNAALRRTQADLVTVWPNQITEGWAERLVVPLMAFSVLAYLPYWLVAGTPYPAASAATGQCMAFQRNAYRTIGGHSAVKSTVLEDVRLARLIKQHGYRLAMVDGDRLLCCRMYVGAWRVIYGYTKNILAGHGSSIPLLLASTLFHCLLFIAPLLWFGVGLFMPAPPAWPFWPLGLYLLAVATRALTAYASRQRLVDAWLVPVSVLIMAYIALRAIWWQLRYGGPSWKGRRIVSGEDAE